MADARGLLRNLPNVDELIRAATDGDGALPRSLLARVAREAVDRLRAEVLAGERDALPDPAAVAAAVRDAAEAAQRPNQCRVINATGVVLHTNLGRAVLPDTVLAEVADRLRGYSLLEVDRETGKRSKRDYLVTELLKELTGAEDAAVVNNNAAATHIVLNTLGRGREAICSHAHLVGIGGSYRLSDCMREAGVTLHTVGATNHCIAADYEGGIRDGTGLIVMVHTSNYQVVGFTKYATLAELVAIGRKHGIPVVYDLGSGALVDVSAHGYDGHSVRELVAEGPAAVFFSGDKLLGGPQAGLIVGDADVIAAIRKNPFYRMMRPDKVTLALLESTLRLYRDPDRLFETVPVLRMISADADRLRVRAERFADRLRSLPGATVDVFDDFSEIGGGSLSTRRMPTVCVGVRSDDASAERIAERLRLGEPCVFGRIVEDRLVFDLRTVLAGEEDELAAAIARAATA